MISLLYSKINKLYSSFGFGRCLQQDLFASLPRANAYGRHDENDCVLYSGDNLVHLLDMAASGPGLIDLCYIDPPYNTGSAFLYEDSRKGPESGAFGKHSGWMEFMLPRLVAAREVLRDDGVIAVSIDDYEHVYLRLLMDRIFGDENFIGNIVVCRSKNGKGSKRNIAPNHEYLVVYGKSKASTLRGAPDDTGKYDKMDEHGRYRVDGLFRKKGEASRREERPNMYYPVYYSKTTGRVFVDKAPGLEVVYPVDSKGVERRWLWSQDTARLNSWKLYASEKGTIYVKNYSSEDKRTKLRSLWSKTSYYTDRATVELKKIYGEKVFDTPKPISFLKDIIDQMGMDDSLILDFFAGAGTTAHAAFELNRADGGNRKVLLMESQDEIPDKHIARKHGFTYISDITLYRLAHIRSLDQQYRYRVVRPVTDAEGSRGVGGRI